MELLEGPKQLPKRQIRTVQTLSLNIPTIVTIEQDLRRLNKLFKSASFVLAQHDVKTLSYLCRKHAQLKVEIRNHFKILKSNSIVTRQLVSRPQMKLNKTLETKISSLRNQIDKFLDRLFQVSPTKRRKLL